MIGNPVDYDNKFKDKFPVFPSHLDVELRRYIDLIPGKEILDLGIGQGRNSIPLSEFGFNVTGVDYSKKYLELCKNSSSNLNLIHSDIRKFDIAKNKYDLILSTYVLHFFHKDDSYNIMNSIKQNLRNNGLVYIALFSKEDPKFDKYLKSKDLEFLGNNIFHSVPNDTYISFFDKGEILDIFNDFKTLYISEEYSLEKSHDDNHYTGVIKYIGMKKKSSN